MGKIILEKFIFYLPLTTSAKELKFNFTESFYLDIKFENLKSNFLEMVFF
jgi:hypothetical protein